MLERAAGEKRAAVGEVPQLSDKACDSKSHSCIDADTTAGEAWGARESR
jgi:hypothetical protein